MKSNDFYNGDCIFFYYDEYCPVNRGVVQASYMTDGNLFYEVKWILQPKLTSKIPLEHMFRSKADCQAYHERLSNAKTLEYITGLTDMTSLTEFCIKRLDMGKELDFTAMKALKEKFREIKAKNE